MDYLSMEIADIHFIMIYNTKSSYPARTQIQSSGRTQASGPNNENRAIA
jgi:hypothetical protein